MKRSKLHRLRDHVINDGLSTNSGSRTRKNDQQGFTLIELMIVVAIMGILAATAIAAYQRYTIRAQVAEGLNLSAPFKTAVGEFFSDSGAFPADNEDAGLSDPNDYVGKYVNSVSINGAIVSIQYGNDAHAQINGETVILTAFNTGGAVTWTCTSGGVIADNYLPSVCR